MIWVIRVRFNFPRAKRKLFYFLSVLVIVQKFSLEHASPFPVFTPKQDHGTNPPQLFLASAGPARARGRGRMPALGSRSCPFAVRFPLGGQGRRQQHPRILDFFFRIISSTKRIHPKEGMIKSSALFCRLTFLGFAF